MSTQNKLKLVFVAIFFGKNCRLTSWLKTTLVSNVLQLNWGTVRCGVLEGTLSFFDRFLRSGIFLLSLFLSRYSIFCLKTIEKLCQKAENSAKCGFTSIGTIRQFQCHWFGSKFVRFVQVVEKRKVFERKLRIIRSKQQQAESMTFQ